MLLFFVFAVDFVGFCLVSWLGLVGACKSLISKYLSKYQLHVNTLFFFAVLVQLLVLDLAT